MKLSPPCMARHGILFQVSNPTGSRPSDLTYLIGLCEQREPIIEEGEAESEARGRNLRGSAKRRNMRCGRDVDRSIAEAIRREICLYNFICSSAHASGCHATLIARDQANEQFVDETHRTHGRDDDVCSGEA